MGGTKSDVDVLIVGAGQAGAQTAISLRKGNFAGSIMLVGEEADAPYDRTALSKDYLANEKHLAEILLLSSDFWLARDVELRLGTRISAVDARAHVASSQWGDVIHYRHLVWAAGGNPRPLPVAGADLRGIHVIRTREQVDQLRHEVRGAASIVVVGGGYIGLEAAAVLSKSGKRVTILEAQDRVLARVVAEPISRFYEAEHRARGVVIRTGVAVAAFGGKNGRVGYVDLADGERCQADLVIVAIGLVPHQAVLAEAGAECGDGIRVDEFCRTTLPDIFAVGDGASHANPFAAGARVRLESVQNAVDQAKVVARSLLDTPEPYRALPWFWSNQYDLKLQTAGLNHGHDETVLRGVPASRSFSLVYLRRGQFIAIDCVNSVRDFTAGKLLVERGSTPDRKMLADPSVPLKTLL
ncbi:NAD(P)/FAD-dependent oxidoreductase [Methylobacterium oxalidis]|uniref:NAD(P)/FAD-dependent oxidoreductase n=1 Tax=Methylobacterium oxalidis TaxID=944322 RepID=UPI00331502A5